MTDEIRLNRLKRPVKFPVNMILDTDTYNEVDDQFALAYCALKKDKINLIAAYAAPFQNSRSTSAGDGMEKSYNEIGKVLNKTDSTIPYYRGSNNFLKDEKTPEDSDAARDLINRAMALSEGEFLYVGAIGCITNIASAILLEPRIIDKIVLVWLGGHAFWWGDAWEFNMGQDIAASRVVLDSGVPLILIPAEGGSSSLKISWPELQYYLKGKSQLADMLYENVMNEMEQATGAWTRVIWDIACPTWLAGVSYFRDVIMPAPVLSYDYNYSFKPYRHMISMATNIERDEIFTDVFETITGQKIEKSKL